MMTYEQGLEAVRYANSYTRAPIVLDIQQHMERSDWLRIVRDEWDGIDNLSKFRRQFKNALGFKGPLPDMMTPKEQQRYDALPAQVTIYRGCSFFDKDAGGLHGMSWTLDFEVAKAFPTLGRYRVEYPVVYRATVKKSRILAVKLERGEEEVITFGVYKDLTFVRVPRGHGVIVEPQDWWGTGQFAKDMMEWGHGRLTSFR
jgi:hypothetical protein